MASQIPPFPGNIGFNAQHAPVGAFMSFTCGHPGTGGGIGIEIGKPAGQNVFVGIKHGGRLARLPVNCLPFVRGVAPINVAVTNFTVENADQEAARARSTVEVYPADVVRRLYGWATDTWETVDFSFNLYTPFGPVPQPTGTDATEPLRASLLPAIVATITVDNCSGSEPKTAVFALDFPEAGTRLLDGAGETDPTRVGFAWRRSMGVLGTLEGDPVAPSETDSLFAFQRWSVADGLSDPNPVHALGSVGGIGMEVPPGKSRTLVLAIGVHLDGVVTTGIEGKYYYTRFYTGLDDVLTAALDRAQELRARSARLDARLLASGLSPHQQFLVAHGTRGYYGSTQLLDVAGEPMWLVNEGEYCMMNTLDLAIDHAFWELEQNPWIVRNVLNTHARHYSYHDQLQGRGGQLLPGGIAFCHDVGAHNNFSPAGQSSYELPKLTGCFSYMTTEELCNWILLAGCYVARTADSQWLLEHTHRIGACAQSLARRADPRKGVMAFDSSRCNGGQEITTYDSLDESLGQARANTYLAVKTWAAWVGIEMLLNLSESAGGSREGQAVGELVTMTESIANYLATCAGVDGVIPAVLERDSRGYASRILPACEALVYPAYWLACLQSRAVHEGDRDDAEMVLERALRHPLVDVLRRHTLALLNDPQRRNFFPDGGIKLSSTSNNSWMSKIALFQYVCREVLRLDEEGDGAIAERFDAADAAHVGWQTCAESAFWACSDQFVKGVAKASRYYPRIIVAALWLTESPRARRRTIEPGAATAPESAHGR